MLRRLIRFVVTSVIITVVIYVTYGSWQTAQSLDGVLRVGTATVQGDGWPEPQQPADIGYVGDPSQAFGFDFRDVEIETELGAAPAWYLPFEDVIRPRWAIFVHGIGGRRENGYRFLPTLHKAEMPVLMITYRNDAGAPASPDGLYSFGLNEWPDLDAAVQYALDHGATEIVLVAESMGGGIVGQFLLQSQHADTIVALVLDAPALDFTAITVDQISRMGLPVPPVLALGGIWLSGLMLPIKIGQANVMDVIADYPGPLFLSHGTADRVVPVSISDDLAARRTAPTDYLRTEADHIASWLEDPARYEAELAGFLATVP